jgi:hypothetical protein
MGYRLDGLGSIPGSARFFSSPQYPDQLCGSVTVAPYPTGTGALSLRVKW